MGLDSDEFPALSGAHVTLVAPDGREVEAAVVWDTRAAYCDACRGLYDCSSRPGLTVAHDGTVCVQGPWCHHCGRRVDIAAGVVVGSVDGEALDYLADVVAVDADDVAGLARWDTLAELDRRVQRAIATLDVDALPSLDAVGPWTVGRDEETGEVGAWAPDPFGGDDLVVVAAPST